MILLKPVFRLEFQARFVILAVVLLNFFCYVFHKILRISNFMNIVALQTGLSDFQNVTVTAIFLKQQPSGVSYILNKKFCNVSFQEGLQNLFEELSMSSMYSQVYLESSETCTWSSFAKIEAYFYKTALSQIFEWVLITPLCTYKDAIHQRQTGPI